MLTFDSYVPDGAGDGAPLIVLLHGRGADKGDLRDLVPHLPRTAIAVLPRAPFPAMPWGYGSGWAWYRFLGGNRPEPESFSRGLAELRTFLAELPARLPVRPGPIVLGGFSQGGTLSLSYALHHPGEIRLVLNFSGFLPDHPAIRVTPDTARRLELFWGHGAADPVIPVAFARDGRREIAEAGGLVEGRDYPIGHWIDPREWADAVHWIEDRLTGSPSSGPEDREPQESED